MAFRSEGNKKRVAGRYGIVQAAIVDNPKITLQAKGIYAIIVASMNDKTEIARLSVSQIAERASISRRYAQTLLGELQRVGAVRRVSGDREVSEWLLPTYDDVATALLFSRGSEP